MPARACEEKRNAVMHANTDALIMFNTDFIMLNLFKKSFPISFSGKHALFNIQRSALFA